MHGWSSVPTACLESLKPRLSGLALWLAVLMAAGSAGAGEKILYALSNNTSSGSDDTLYSMNPDGTGA